MHIIILLPIISTLAYHLLMKSTINSNISPLLMFLLIYIISILITLSALLISEDFDVKELLNIKDKWKYLLIGVSIFGVELGYILSYRLGWNINITAIFTNTSVAILMIPLGYIIFKESLSTIQIIGIILSISGLILIGL